MDINIKYEYEYEYEYSFLGTVIWEKKKLTLYFMQWSQKYNCNICYKYTVAHANNDSNWSTLVSEPTYHATWHSSTSAEKNIFVAVASLRPRNSDVSTWRLSLYVLWKLPPKFNGYAGSYRYFQTKRKYM